MSRDIQLRLTGRAEKFFDDQEKEGVTERDLLGYALGLLDAVASGRLAMLKESPDAEDVENAVDYIFALPGQRVEQRKSVPNLQSGRPAATAPVGTPPVTGATGLEGRP